MIASLRERCSLDPSTGFEVFVPGRQDMATAMNPVFRSAYLIRRTVSQLCLAETPASEALAPEDAALIAPFAAAV